MMVLVLALMFPPMPAPVYFPPPPRRQEVQPVMLWNSRAEFENSLAAKGALHGTIRPVPKHPIKLKHHKRHRD